MNKVLSDLLVKYPDLLVCKEDIFAAFDLMWRCYHENGKILVCGNGGSAADSEHITGELMKGFKSARELPSSVKDRIISLFPDDGDYLCSHLQGAIPAISLTSNSTLNTAFANDVAPDMIFAQQVYGYGNKDDILIGLSTSGNSLNVLRALQVARVKDMATIGLTGKSGGKMIGLCDVLIRVPHTSTSDIQELHLPVYHAICLMLENEFFG
jgi:D-sedoheptulose 7-phosphate isomerase